MKTLKQVVVIHGGDFFDSRAEFLESLKGERLEREDLFHDEKKRWKDNLQRDLGNEYEVMRPRMPLKEDAKYEEWKIWFEKMFPFFTEDIILIGHSLGGIFLARYLSENIFPISIGAVYLIAAPYFAAKSADHNAGFVITNDLTKLSKLNLHFYYSEDDDIVPVSHARRYQKDVPDAFYHVFTDKGHFFAQEHFPELVSSIRDL